MAEGMDRRDFLRNSALVATGIAVGGLGVLSLRAVLPPDAAPTPATIVQPGTSTPVRLSDLLHPAPLMVTAEYLGGPAVIAKVPVATLRAAASVRGYDTGQFAVRHPDDPETALLAYDGRCTHLGCTVGWMGSLGASRDVADYDGDGTPDGRIMCPCHQSQFDVHDLGANLPGMPAQRPLDVIPLTIAYDHEGGYLVGQRRIHQDKARAADERGRGAAFSL